MKFFSFHPKAYLPMKRNVKKGLIARSKLLSALNHGEKILKELCKETNMYYSKAFYHINLMTRYKVVSRNKKKPYRWRLTGYGQQVLS